MQHSPPRGQAKQVLLVCLIAISAFACKQGSKDADKQNKSQSPSGSDVKKTGDARLSGECANLVGKLYGWDGAKTCTYTLKHNEAKIFLGTVKLTSTNGFQPSCAFVVYNADRDPSHDNYEFYVQDNKDSRWGGKSPGNYMKAVKMYSPVESGNFVRRSTNYMIDWKNGELKPRTVPDFVYYNQTANLSGKPLESPSASAFGSMNVQSKVEKGSGTIDFDLALTFQKEDQPVLESVAGTVKYDLNNQSLLCDVKSYQFGNSH